MRAWLPIVLLLGSCAEVDDDASAAMPETVAEAPAVRSATRTQHEILRNDARLVLEANCGQCHISDYDTALPRALAVFDLRDEEWSAHMTSAQLIDARGRVSDRRGPDGPLEISDRDVARVAAYVAAELARRGD